MADEDYLLVPADVRYDMERRHQLPGGEPDWAAIEREVRQRYPQVLGVYGRTMQNGGAA